MNYKKQGYFCKECEKEVGILPGYKIPQCTECGAVVELIDTIQDTDEEKQVQPSNRTHA